MSELLIGNPKNKLPRTEPSPFLTTSAGQLKAVAERPDIIDDRVNALCTFGSTPFQSPTTPSARTILVKASKRPEYLGWRPWLTVRLSACILTLIRSAGLAITYASPYQILHLLFDTNVIQLL
ncbi:hypothetical protein ACJIZ3_018679 [Penstemon smallii]|uniref:Uncharacterized protein n=1 Tax=Penstemon smallii TaxID=265156 RepID=A0ABD3SZ05_9LAMI